MALNYRLDIASPTNTLSASEVSPIASLAFLPATGLASAAALIAAASAGASYRSYSFTADTGNVVSIETNLKKDRHRVSYLTAVINDPGLKIFNALPDNAFANVPVNLYLGPDNSSSTPTTLVFSGKMTKLEMGYPEYDKITIDAHDNTIDMRRTKRYRTFKNKTSVQVAQQIAADYGMTVTADLGGEVVVTRSSEIGAEISDWDLLCRALNYDGLSVYARGKQIVVKLTDTLVYQTTFQRDAPPVISLNCQILHVSGPGEGGDTKSTVALEQKGTYAAMQSAQKAEADKVAASQRTHRRPVGAPPLTSKGSHTEAPGNTGWTNQITKRRRRKDEASMVCTLLADIGLQHKAKLSGWGAKVDDEWFISTIKHVLIGSSYGQTTLSMHRAPSVSAANQAGVAFAK